jgi:hypothetical protein
VLMAGVPKEWVRKEGFSVKNLRTPFGLLTYSLTVKDKERTLEIAAMPKLPVGGFAIAWPEGREGLGRQVIESGSARWIGNELRVGKLPFKVTFTE